MRTISPMSTHNSAFVDLCHVVRSGRDPDFAPARRIWRWPPFESRVRAILWRGCAAQEYGRLRDG